MRSVSMTTHVYRRTAPRAGRIDLRETWLRPFRVSLSRTHCVTAQKKERKGAMKIVSSLIFATQLWPGGK
eukprot:scaffold8641_cov92-Amphora_coffeaeformis.AAC.5